MNEARPALLDGDAAAALIEPLTDLVIAAGRAILAVNRAAMKVDGKSDGSPVTEADLAADRIIGAGLARLAPNLAALSEERVGLATPPYKDSFFLVDPLDGTKEFVAGRREFTVNIALVTEGTPLLGIVGAPALGVIWRGIVGRGAERLTLRDGATPADGGHCRAQPAAHHRRPVRPDSPSHLRILDPARHLHGGGADAADGRVAWLPVACGSSRRTTRSGTCCASTATRTRRTWGGPGGSFPVSGKDEREPYLR